MTNIFKVGDDDQKIEIYCEETGPVSFSVFNLSGDADEAEFTVSRELAAAVASEILLALSPR